MKEVYIYFSCDFSMLMKTEFENLVQFFPIQLSLLVRRYVLFID